MAGWRDALLGGEELAESIGLQPKFRMQEQAAAPQPLVSSWTVFFFVCRPQGDGRKVSLCTLPCVCCQAADGSYGKGWYQNRVDVLGFTNSCDTTAERKQSNILPDSLILAQTSHPCFLFGHANHTHLLNNVLCWRDDAGQQEQCSRQQLQAVITHRYHPAPLPKTEEEVRGRLLGRTRREDDGERGNEAGDGRAGRGLSLGDAAVKALGRVRRPLHAAVSASTPSTARSLFLHLHAFPQHFDPLRGETGAFIRPQLALVQSVSWLQARCCHGCHGWG